MDGCQLVLTVSNYRERMSPNTDRSTIKKPYGQTYIHHTQHIPAHSAQANARTQHTRTHTHTPTHTPTHTHTHTHTRAKAHIHTHTSKCIIFICWPTLFKK